jgi:hypothetical protein
MFRDIEEGGRAPPFNPRRQRQSAYRVSLAARLKLQASRRLFGHGRR